MLSTKKVKFNCTIYSMSIILTAVILITVIFNNNLFVDANGQMRLDDSQEEMRLNNSIFEKNNFLNNNSNISSENLPFIPQSLMNFSNIDICLFAPYPTPGCYQTYSNVNYGINILYPRSWIITDINSSEPSFNKYNIKSFMLNFTNPSSNTKVIIGNDIADSSFSLPAYLTDIIQTYKGVYEDFTLLSSNIGSSSSNNDFLQLAGLPAYNIIYTYTENPVSTKAKNIFLANEIGIIIPNTDLVYYLSYSSPIKFYSQYEQFTQPIRDSLTINLNTNNLDSNNNEGLQGYDRNNIINDGLI